MTLGAGETIEINTNTPTFEPGIENSLDPELLIYDLNGNVVAKDRNSAADGKNALLEFTATSAGIYQVQVVATSGAGEYVLKLQSDNPTGDFDLDGDFDCDDINQLTTAIAAGNADPQLFDLNNDQVVDRADLDTWRAIAGGANLGAGRVYPRGDANLDGTVDGTDFGIWNTHKFTFSSRWCEGDFNADGGVDGSDYGIWNSNRFSMGFARGTDPTDGRRKRGQGTEDIASASVAVSPTLQEKQPSLDVRRIDIVMSQFVPLHLMRTTRPVKRWPMSNGMANPEEGPLRPDLG